MSQDVVTSMIRKFEFYDSERNKTAKGIRRKYGLIRKQNFVLDRCTGLVWQYSCLADRLNYNQAENYILKINRERFGRYDDWRLPTLEEAMSLVEPSKNEFGLFINRQFDCKNKLWWIWTADKFNAERAWIVDFKFGFCHDTDINDDNNKYVLAVRTHSEIMPRIRLRSDPCDNFGEEVEKVMSLTDSIQRFKKDHDPEKTVFVMMKFAGGDRKKDKKLQKLYETIKDELDRFGLDAVRADEKDYAPDLWPNVKVYLSGCGYGIAVLENLYSDVNPNVALEYGFMIAKLEDERKVLLLKEKSFTKIQADLGDKLWKEFDIDKIQSIKRTVSNWLSVTLGLSAYKEQQSI